MKITKFRSLVQGLILAVFLATAVQAADEKKKDMSADMHAQMEKMQKLGTPGAGHEVLKPAEGVWTVKSKSWMNPGDKAQESTGTAKMEWVLDGRFLKQEFKGSWKDHTGKDVQFEGIGYTGYDNMTEKYTSTWMDSMMTGMFVSNNGNFNASKKTITDEGNFSCPMTGEAKKWFKSEWKIDPKKNKQTFTMYMKDEKGKEYKSMVMEYTKNQDTASKV